MFADEFNQDGAMTMTVLGCGASPEPICLFVLRTTEEDREFTRTRVDLAGLVEVHTHYY
jgi:hypothetical protein